MKNINSKFNQKSKLENHNSPKLKAVYISVSGDVQGVFYRHYAKKEAKKHGINGWITNEHDGSVTMYVQGDEIMIDQMIEWARIGSPMAKVEEITVENATFDDTQKDFITK